MWQSDLKHWIMESNQMNNAYQIRCHEKQLLRTMGDKIYSKNLKFKVLCLINLFIGNIATIHCFEIGDIVEDECRYSC